MEKKTTLHLCRCFLLYLRRGGILLLILLQFCIWILFLTAAKKAFQVPYTLFRGVGFCLSLCVLRRDIPSVFKLSWVFFLLLMPLPAGVIYGLLQWHRKKKPVIAPFSAKAIDSAGLPRVAKTLLYAGYTLCPAEGDRFYPSGDDFYIALKDELRKAERYIFLEYYLIAEGEMWNGIAEILREKADGGVDVRMIIDDVGCFFLRSRHTEKTLRRMGIRVAVFHAFSPFITSAQNCRDHRKLAVIDGRVAFTGGINIGDEYIGRRIRFGVWKDTAVKVEGRAARAFSRIFLEMWKSVSRESTEIPPSLTGEVEKNLQNGFVIPYESRPCSHTTAKNLMLTLLSSAEKSIYISTPYLVPCDSLTDALCLASESGIDVRIVVPHIPDKKAVFFVTRSYYRKFLASGVKIYEYTPGFIHAKQTVVDGICGTLGSANLDCRSLYESFESGVLLYKTPTVESIQNDFLSLFRESTLVTEDTLPKETRLYRLFAEIPALFAPLM